MNDYAPNINIYVVILILHEGRNFYYIPTILKIGFLIIFLINYIFKNVIKLFIVKMQLIKYFYKFKESIYFNL